MILAAEHISKAYTLKTLLTDATLYIEDGDKIGIIGINGTGKSTLLKILARLEEPDEGIVTKGSKVRIGYLPQNPEFRPGATLLEAVFDGVGADVRELKSYEARTILTRLGFADMEQKVDHLSGGQKKKVALAAALVRPCELLILDEPTNHLDFQTVMWLEDYLKDYKGALLLVSHDRYFLDRLCTSVCEIERGKLTRYKGNYTAFTQLKEAAVARQWKEYEMQQKEIAKLEDYVARNLTRASTAKSAQSRVKQLEKMERIEKPPAAQKQARIQFTYEADPPVELLKVQGIDISVGEGTARKTLLPELSFEVRRGEKWGIIGENGIGKSTLLKIIQGKLPHLGKVRWTSNVKISYFEQESTNLHPAKSVMQEIHDRVPSWTDLEVRKLLGQVRLTGENVFKPVGVLSGGERAKVCFAVMMLEHGNVLILDEPTNHLDIAMKEVIEDAMETFGGTILFVSHDRYLLDRVADHILELKADGAFVYQGGFSAWRDAQQKASAAEAAAAAETQEPRPPKGEKPAYRSKKQRSQQAKFRADLRSLEQNLDRMQEELDQLTAELADEAVCSDYQLMQEKCARMEELRVAMDETMEKMIELEDALS